MKTEKKCHLQSVWSQKAKHQNAVKIKIIVWFEKSNCHFCSNLLPPPDTHHPLLPISPSLVSHIFIPPPCLGQGEFILTPSYKSVYFHLLIIIQVYLGFISPVFFQEYTGFFFFSLSHQHHHWMNFDQLSPCPSISIHSTLRFHVISHWWASFSAPWGKIRWGRVG